MFKRTAVAYNESPEASRALVSAIRLAKLLEAELQVVTVMQEPPAYTAYATVALGCMGSPGGSDSHTEVCQ